MKRWAYFQTWNPYPFFTLKCAFPMNFVKTPQYLTFLFVSALRNLLDWCNKTKGNNCETESASVKFSIWVVAGPCPGWTIVQVTKPPEGVCGMTLGRHPDASETLQGNAEATAWTLLPDISQDLCKKWQRILEPYEEVQHHFQLCENWPLWKQLSSTSRIKSFPLSGVTEKNNNKLFPPWGMGRNCIAVLDYDPQYYLIDIQGCFILIHKQT